MLTIKNIVNEKDLSVKLNKHRSKMVKAAKINRVQQGEAKKLQKFLNDTFFSKENNKINKINNFIEGIYEKILNRKTNGDFSIVNTTYNFKDVCKMAREKNESFSHTKKIYMTTLKERRAKVEEFIKHLHSLENQEGIIAQAETLKMNLNNIINQSKKFLIDKNGEEYIDLQDLDNKDLVSLINTADELYEILSAYPITPSDYGDILEWALGALNNEAEILGEEITEDLFNDFIKKYVSGGNRIQENVQITAPNTKLLESYKVKKNQEKDEEFEYKINDNLSFKYFKSFNPYSGRQMKMDVNLSLPGIRKTPFRISAKNWKSIKGQDFGQTNLIYALIRSAGEEYAQRYNYILSYKKAKGNLLQEAHALAKISIVLDILMGFSQRDQSGYADTIVMLDRTTGKFQVESIGWIIHLINQTLDNSKFKIKDYDESNLVATARQIRESFQNKKKNKSETIQSILYKYFQSVNISLRYSDIFSNLKKI